MKIKILLTALLMTGLSHIGLSQNIDKEALKLRAAQKVKQMTDNISRIADKSRSVSTRESIRSKTLVLFINKGEAFKEVYDGGYEIQRQGVFMETSSLKCKTCDPKKTLMTQYLTNLIKLNYSQVKIESTDVSSMEVSSLQKINDNEYVCTVYFEQAFAGYRDGRPVYKDITRKSVEVHIAVEETLDGTEYIIRLGDVHALDTRAN
jgi:hypothetical protein